MAKDIPEAVREICRALPETDERPSRGSPNFRVAGKTFAILSINHHGDGKIALWLNAPPGAQALHTAREPGCYFVPPYVGPRGWLGVELDRGLGWDAIAERLLEAYRHVAPARLAAADVPVPRIKPPTRTVDAECFDPLRQPRAKAILAELEELCLGLPETSAALQFGSPVFKAGKKSFCGAHRHGGRLRLEFRVDAERQATLTFDERYSIPRYIGRHGWIALDVEDHIDWDEVHALALASYRRVALKRMLHALDGALGRQGSGRPQ